MDKGVETNNNESITTSCSIDDILKSLSWNNPCDVIFEGLKIAKSVKCLKAFFQPICSEYGKDTWENCAIVICERRDDELEFYIEDMIYWMQDINWPGALQITNRLLKMENVTLLASVIDTIVPALNFIGEEQWLINLGQLLSNQTLCKSLKCNTVLILREYCDD